MKVKVPKGIAWKGSATMLVSLVLLLVVPFPAAAGGGTLPRGGEIDGWPLRSLLPPDAIRAVDDPRPVAAGEAPLAADGRVLGVVVGGEARAYSLELMNVHEIINDHLGGLSVAATW